MHTSLALVVIQIKAMQGFSTRKQDKKVTIFCESFNGLHGVIQRKKGHSKEVRKRQIQMAVFLPAGDKIPNKFNYIKHTNSLNLLS